MQQMAPVNGQQTTTTTVSEDLTNETKSKLSVRLSACLSGRPIERKWERVRERVDVTFWFTFLLLLLSFRSFFFSLQLVLPNDVISRLGAQKQSVTASGWWLIYDFAQSQIRRIIFSLFPFYWVSSSEVICKQVYNVLNVHRSDPHPFIVHIEALAVAPTEPIDNSGEEVKVLSFRYFRNSKREKGVTPRL